MFFIDEFPIPFRNDSLKKRLRELEEVPNADYLVENERVFVFDALVERVRKISSESPPNKSLKEIALTALPLAWMSALEAVIKWKIVPVPYEKVEVEGKRAILHKPFNALLPGRYTNEEDCNRDLASLLLGQTLFGEGDLVFAGQAMSLRQSLDPNLLPPRPVLRELQELPSTQSETLFSHLLKLTYEPGFTPLSKEWFERIKTLEFEWAAFNTRIKSLIYSNVKPIWSRTEEIDWAQWNETVTGEEAREDLRQLRYYYPELYAMPDGALYSLFDTYQMDCKFINGWTAYREDEFFFFLLGLLSVPRNTNGQYIVPVGEFVGYEVLRGQSSHVAVEAGKVWFAYNEAIYNLAYRVSQLVEFLRSPSDVKRGRPIFIFEDWFNMFRKAGSSSITWQQSLF